MKHLTTWFPLAVLAVLIAALFARRPAPPVDEVEPLAALAVPEFTPVDVPRGERSVRGRLTYADGAAAPRVALYARSGDMPQWVETDVEGAFVLTGLGDEPLEVVAFAWDHPSAAWTITADQVELSLVLGPRIEGVARLEDVRRAALAGRLSRSVAGAELGCEVLLVPADPPLAPSPLVPRRTLAGDDGSFRFDELALGPYRVAVLPRWAHGGSWPDLLAPGHAVVEHTGAGAELALALADAEITGAVLDPAGEPVGGALVLVSTAGSESRWFPWVVTADDGSFRLGDLPAGRYRLEVSAGEGSRTEADVALAAGESRALPAFEVLLRRTERGPKGPR